ncbi:hypothetical protein AAE478_009901 [Parahypoxylon ruwenzoriense]
MVGALPAAAPHYYSGASTNGDLSSAYFRPKENEPKVNSHITPAATSVMGTDQKPTSVSASMAAGPSGRMASTALYVDGISQYGSTGPTVSGAVDKNFRFEDLLWADGGNGMLPVGTGGMYGAGDKCLEIGATGFPYGAPLLFVSDNASSLTYSPPSSYQGSVWSPIQTDLASEVPPMGASTPSVQSPLRNVAKPLSEFEGEYVRPKERSEAGKKYHGLQFETEYPYICLWGSCESKGFKTRGELNWHVKREHLLLCPVPGCPEGGFGSGDFLDCHLRCAHRDATADKDATFRPSSLLEATVVPLGTSTSNQIRATTKKAASEEYRVPKIGMSIDISKKRCRDQLRAVLEKRLKRANGGSPKAIESSKVIRNRTPKLLESASFPIIWEHGVLPFLVEFVPKWCGPGHVISVMRGNKPTSRRICIMTKHVISRARRLAIAGHVRDLLPEPHRSLVTFVFPTGKVDRLVWARGLSKEISDEVCLPRNPFCYTFPCMGDSIGMTSEDGDEITATLGPCVMVGDMSYWLVNFHPFVEASKGTRRVSVEHPSPADRARCLYEKHDALKNGDPDFRIGNLTATSGFNLETTRISHDPYWEECDKEPPLVVMDWALVSATTRKANMLRKFPTASHRREVPVTSMSSVVPGAAVCSTGRTSGFQRGQVCEIPAYLDGSENGTGKASREWYIEEPYPYEDEEGWIRGGIGVEGDSGAAIIDCETNALVGQLWGRNKYYGPGPRWTYFTPIFDIFDDIQERCDQERRPQLPQYRDEAGHRPVYPICRQCFDLRDYLESRRSSRESLISMIGMHDVIAGDNDNDLTSVSELATPKDQFYLIRHIGPEETSSSFGGVVSPAPIHAFYTSISQVMSPGNTELRSPYAQVLDEEDLYEKCSGASEIALGKRPALIPPATHSGGQQSAKRRKVT